MKNSYFRELHRITLVTHMVPDVLAITISAGVAYLYRFSDQPTQYRRIATSDFDYKSILVATSLVWLTVLILGGSYDGTNESIFVFQPFPAIKKTIFFFLALGFVSFLTKASFSRIVFLVMLLIGVLLIFLFRLLVFIGITKPLLHSKRLSAKLIVVGTSQQIIDEYSNWIKGNSRFGYKVIAQLEMKKIELDVLEKFERMQSFFDVTDVLILPGIENDPNFAKFVHFLEDLKLRVNWIPSNSGNFGYWLIPVPIEGIPFYTFKKSEMSLISQTLKRFFDLFFSVFAIIVLSPILFFIAGAILISDGFPIIYAQKRVGRNGVLFKFYKFRSMVKNAESLVGNVTNVHGDSHILFKNPNDPRITPIGHILRRYSLDVLPQFFNVVLNHMSVVGPRPALPHEAQAYDSLYERRLLAKPGITGPWQVSGRSELDLKSSVSLDLNYLLNWSFTQDLYIILRTVREVFRGRGAY